MAGQVLGCQHSGFSVNAGLRIAAHDRAGLERLLRYCVSPPFAMERLRLAILPLLSRWAQMQSIFTAY